MSQEELIMVRLETIEKKLTEQALATKTVLNFNEGASFLDLSKSHLYKLTSQKRIPHFCPEGKKIYFLREDLQNWLLRNRQEEEQTVEERLNSLTIGNGEG
ncbi:helix-turn-helix domain-containing protein [Carboxylicivirga sp. A043]|uniref:helix-turn-helix domain-containing protein n=1 Tax=Carboxylicivirga litoralis TaxID=2816963 RepID=UPI0021CAEF45|nr:helix-turn-helix domain-containing protein [Carboxylicivirga sp. A043]MCU4155236.1 helix-turn-helix domain-containing protein [Carboxylicivirga sp. A043]